MLNIVLKVSGSLIQTETKAQFLKLLKAIGMRKNNGKPKKRLIYAKIGKNHIWALKLAAGKHAEELQKKREAAGNHKNHFPIW